MVAAQDEDELSIALAQKLHEHERWNPSPRVPFLILVFLITPAECTARHCTQTSYRGTGSRWGQAGATRGDRPGLRVWRPAPNPGDGAQAPGVGRMGREEVIAARRLRATGDGGGPGEVF